MSWYDELLEYQFDWLRNNKTPFGLCPEWKQEVFYAMHAEDIGVLQVYDSSSGWIPYDRAFGFPTKSSTYRLNPDWKRPEEKPEPEPEPEKKEGGHWEYCEVEERNCNGGEYSFDYKNVSKNVRWALHYALSIVGFGGIEFEERSGQWCWSLMGWNVSDEYLIDSDAGAMGLIKPATPKRVRFWVEG